MPPPENRRFAAGCFVVRTVQAVDNDDGSSWYNITNNVLYWAEGLKMDYGGFGFVNRTVGTARTRSVFRIQRRFALSQVLCRHTPRALSALWRWMQTIRAVVELNAILPGSAWSRPHRA